MPGPIKIVLIEDDPDDIEFLREAFREFGGPAEFNSLIRGDLAIDWASSTTEIPDIIVMDLNLPKIHGRDVLCRIRENQKFAKIPVVVLTTSSLREDKAYCLEKGADKFFTKPASPEGFQLLVESLYRVTSRKQAQSAGN
jgi:DNA-binding response OmpR family regulator